MLGNFLRRGSSDIYRTISTCMPTAVFLISYILTTVLAATIYLLPNGAEYITSRTGPIAQKAYQAIGSPTYLALLYLPVIVVPAISLLTIKIIRRSSAFNRPLKIDLGINTKLLWAIFVISVAFCTYKLSSADALDMGVVSSGDYIAKTIRRLNLLSDLGFIFFAFAYGINLLIPILAFISYVKQGGKTADLALFIISFVFFIFIITATYSKAQILIYLIMMMSAFAITRAKIKYILIISIVSVASFVLTGYAMNPSIPDTEKNISINQGSGINEKESASKEINSEEFRYNSPITTTSDAAHSRGIEIDKAEKASNGPVKIEPNLLASYMKKLSGDALHRMAAALPFYVAIFESESERCGIQGNLVRKVLIMPEPECVLPVKVFNAMYPEVDWAQGQQPAPAALSAYGEIGMGWSICVMVITGILLGAFGVLGASNDSPLFIGFTVAACSGAYYLTQVSIVAAFTYPHGLFVFMTPIAILFISAISKRNTQYNMAI